MEVAENSSRRWLRPLWQHFRKGEAQELLSEAYGWFTEGFDTTDLRAGKMLLDNLGNE